MSMKSRAWGIALSGRGSPAILYHLGVLQRLNGSGLLPHITCISCVSAGALLAARLAAIWPKLNFLANSAVNFDDLVTDVIRKLCSTDVEQRASDASLLIPGHDAGDSLIPVFDDLLENTSLAALTKDPSFTFICSDLFSGEAVAIDASDSDLPGDTPLSKIAIAAIAHPPCLAARRMGTPRHVIMLMDGSLCDPLAIDHMLGRVQWLYISDGACREAPLAAVDVAGYAQYPAAVNAALTQFRTCQMRMVFGPRRLNSHVLCSSLVKSTKASVCEFPGTGCLRALRDDVAVQLVRAGYDDCEAELMHSCE
jgi:predicted acylesterase/phospholipase RssA